MKTETLSYAEHCERMLRAGYQLAELPQFCEPDPSTTYAPYPIAFGYNVAATWSGLCVIRLDHSWAHIEDVRKAFEEQFDGPHVPKIIAPKCFEAWFYKFTVPFHSLRSGRIADPQTGYADLQLIAGDSQWHGVVVPPSKLWPTAQSIITTQWRDPAVIAPPEAPEALVDLLASAHRVTGPGGY